MTLLTIQECDLAGKRVLIREDFNVPMQSGQITSDARLRAALPTIEYALAHGAAVLLMSHLGRPIIDQSNSEFSLAPVAKQLSALLNKPVRFSKDWLQGVVIKPGEIVLCENVRFQAGEKTNDVALSKQIAALCDVFVMDAFGAAHRAHASTYGVACYAPVACAGLLLVNELHALTKALQHPQKPIVAIVGGSKVSSKLKVLHSLIDLADYVIVGGGIANTLIAAQGYDIGKSLVETALIPEAQHLLKLAANKGCKIPLPSDVKIANRFAADVVAITRNIDTIQTTEMILDIGEQTTQQFAAIIHRAKTIIWNGPVGVFEFPAFAQGSVTLAQAIADSDAFSIAGGGDTLALIDQLNIHDKISYVSTGGGAFLEFLESKSLPAIDILNH